MLRSKKIKPVLFSGLFLGSLFLFNGLIQTQPTKQQSEPSIGNSKTLISAYDRWKVQKKIQGKEHLVSLPLTFVKGHSSEFNQAKGRAKLNLINGEFGVNISGLDPDSSFDVWFLDKQENTAVSSSNNLHIGQLQRNNSTASLQITLNASDLAGFELSRVVITHATQTPEQGTLLSGSPTLFQRLFYNERR
ncbi:MAG: hypothetical protein KAR12_01535, partial [Methylococcales bacterium]|nr:hypothetical protein [Methylococcales bacterium]